MTDAQTFFVNESIALARALPLSKATQYLLGLLQSVKDDPEFTPLRSAYISLRDSDHQLELISLGQLKLPFDGKNH